MNIANRWTMVRVVLIPFFIAALLLGFPVIATAIFVAASITDAIDGHLARKLNLVSNFGKIVDPLADKLLVCSALLCLCQLGVIGSVPVIIVLAREFVVSGLRTVAAGEGNVIAAGWSGKIKTVLQMIAVPLLILQENFHTWFGLPTLVPQLIFWLSVAATIISGLEYLIKNREVFLKGV